MEYPTLPQSFLAAIDGSKAARTQIHNVGDRWKDISGAEMLRRVARLSSALAEVGIAVGDRVAIFAPNCPEWHQADFAILGLGAVTVPVYFRESSERIEYILNHAETKVVFVHGQQQTERLFEVRGRVRSVKRVIVIAAAGAARSSIAAAGAAGSGIAAAGAAGSDVAAADAARAKSGGSGGTLEADLRYEDIVAEAGIGGSGEADVATYRRRVAELKPEQLASIIYTSGTTGEPKGVMLSHSNFTSNVKGSFEGFAFRADDVALSFLPLAHVYERLADYCYLFHSIPLAYVERPEDVTHAMLQVRPTIVTAVPRFFEKLYAAVLEGGGKATGLRKTMFDWAMRVAGKSAPWRVYGRSVSVGTKLEWELADRLVYKKFRAGVGGRVRVFVSGGAPLATPLAEFITTVGLPVLQGYGLTESSPVIASNTTDPEHNRIGTVGRPLRNLEVRIAGDGEILVRGPSVMLGYYKKPEETKEAISPDGWLATGDIGHLDADGYLVITDRKKELLKTAGGKLVAPAPIENVLKGSRYIANVALVGDRQRFIAALIVPDFAHLEQRANQEGVALGSPAEACANPWTRKLMESEIARLTANLAQYESIKRFALLDHDFTFESGELTYTLKLKRRVIEEHYAKVIEGLYAEASPAR